MAYNPNNPNGQATMANSAPVVIASNQSAIPITDNSGSLTVDGTVTASNVSGDVAAGATDSGNPVKVGGKHNTTQPTLTDGQRGDLQLSTRGNLKVTIFDNNTATAVGFQSDNSDAVAASSGTTKMQVAARNTVFNGTTWDRMPGDTTGIKVQDGGNSLTVDNGGTFVVQENGAALTSLQLIDDGVATVASAITTKGMAAVGTDGTNARILKTDTNGELQVDVLSLPTVTIQDGGNTITVDNGGTFAVQAAQSGAWSIASTSTAGDVAHDTTDSGNPVKIGFKAFTTNPTRVADGDRVNGVADVAGRQVVVMNQVRDLTFHNSATLSSTTETSILAGVASTYHDITQIIATNTSASQVRVDFRDATAGSVILSISLAPSGGAVIPFAHPLKQTTANNNWTAQLSTAVTDVRIFMQAVKNT